MSTNNPTIANLQRAVAIAEKIQELESQLASILGSPAQPTVAKARQATTKSVRGRKRTMSPEARARIAAAQKARWAKVKGGKTPAAAPNIEKKAAAKPKAKRNVSPEARAKMAAAAKRRWAKVK